MRTIIDSYREDLPLAVRRIVFFFVLVHFCLVESGFCWKLIHMDFLDINKY